MSLWSEQYSQNKPYCRLCVSMSLRLWDYVESYHIMSHVMSHVTYHHFPTVQNFRQNKNYTLRWYGTGTPKLNCDDVLLLQFKNATCPARCMPHMKNGSLHWTKWFPLRNLFLQTFNISKYLPITFPMCTKSANQIFSTILISMFD